MSWSILERKVFEVFDKDISLNIIKYNLNDISENFGYLFSTFILLM